jgi:uncharacterized protein (DUF2225 family)
MMTDEEKKEIAGMLFTLLKDQKLVVEYIRKHGFTVDPKHVKAIKEHKNAPPSAPAPAPAAPGAPGQHVNPAVAARAARLKAINDSNAAAAEAAKAAAIEAAKLKSQQSAAAKNPVAEEDQDPVFETAVNCPICGHVKITNYELRAKSQQMIQTALLVPVYSGAKGFKTVDYSYLSVTVCPKCLFASPDKKNFNYPSFTGTSEEKSTLSASVILDLKDKTEERKKILPAALGNLAYFRRERSPQVAIESYRLAMARAQSEADLTQPYAYYKMGSYALKIAHIMKNNGEDESGVLKEALGFFEQSFSKSECETDELEMQVVYLIVALNIKLRELNQANSYLGVFGKLMIERQEQMKKNPSLNTQWIEKWQERAKYLWEERENPAAFDKMR